MDPSSDGMVRPAARDGGTHGAMPGPPRRSYATARRLALGVAGSAAGEGTMRESHEHFGCGSRTVPAGRGASRAGSLRQSRSRVSRVGSVRLRTATGARVVATRPKRTIVATSAIRRALSETTDPVRRARLLPASVEIFLIAGRPDEAHEACREIEQSSKGRRSELLDALAAHSRGAFQLAEGKPQAALGTLRRAFQAWRQLEVPYEAARVRVLIAKACRILGDEEAAALELNAARDAFRKLRAAPDLARADALARRDRVRIGSWVDQTRTGGASPGRRGPIEQGCCPGLGAEQQNNRTSSQQHF